LRIGETARVTFIQISDSIEDFTYHNYSVTGYTHSQYTRGRGVNLVSKFYYGHKQFKLI